MSIEESPKKKSDIKPAPDKDKNVPLDDLTDSELEDVAGGMDTIGVTWTR